MTQYRLSRIDDIISFFKYRFKNRHNFASLTSLKQLIYREDIGYNVYRVHDKQGHWGNPALINMIIVYMITQTFFPEMVQRYKVI